MSRANTAVLIEGVAKGSQSASSELYCRVSPLLLAQARFLLGAVASSEAEDLVHETWLVGVTPEKLAVLQPRNGELAPALLSYLAVVLRHKYKNWARKDARRRLRGGPDEVEGAPAVTRGVATKVHLQQLGAVVQDVLATLSDRDREIVVLIGIEERRPREIADQLQMLPNAVSKAYSRALARVRDAMDPELWLALEALAVT